MGLLNSLVVLALAAALPAANQGTASRHSGGPIGSDSATLTCHSGGAILGSGKPGWRRQASYAGPIGLWGAGRDFTSLRRGANGRFQTKTPAIVEGYEPVELVVPMRERQRVGIGVGVGDHPYAAVSFIPCGNKPRTIWPAGLVLRDRKPVTLQVQAGAWTGSFRVGRVPRTDGR